MRYALVVTVCLLLATVAAKEFYVSPLWGAEDNDGSNDAPYLEISQALSVAEPGDIVYLLPGIYSGNGNVGIEFEYSVTVALAPGAHEHSADINGNGQNCFYINSGDVQFRGLLFTHCVAAIRAGPSPSVGDQRPTLVVDSCTFAVSNYGVFHSGYSTFASISFANSVAEYMGNNGIFADYYSNDECIITITNSTFIDSPCDIGYTAALTTVVDSTFKDTAGRVALTFNNGPGLVKNCLFTSNLNVVHEYGTMEVLQSFVQVFDSVFEENIAERGGGIFMSDAVLELSGSTFRSNGAYSGGGVYVDGSAQMTNCTFSNNAAFDGAACLKSNSSHVVSSDIILENNLSNVIGNCFANY